MSKDTTMSNEFEEFMQNISLYYTKENHLKNIKTIHEKISSFKDNDTFVVELLKGINLNYTYWFKYSLSDETQYIIPFLKLLIKEETKVGLLEVLLSIGFENSEEIFNTLDFESSEKIFDLIFPLIKDQEEFYNYILSDKNIFKYKNFIEKEKYALLAFNSTLDYNPTDRLKKYLLLIILDIKDSPTQILRYFKKRLSEDEPENLNNEFNALTIGLDEEYRNKLLTLISQDVPNELSNVRNMLILMIESHNILHEYTNLNLVDMPESLAAIKIFTNKIKLNKHIEKTIKQNKPLLALHLLVYYGQCSIDNDSFLVINNYIKALIGLEKIDLLAKYYHQLQLANEDINFLQLLTEYYIKIKDVDNAKSTLNDIMKIEPTFPFINIAQNEIKKISMINKLSADDIDIDRINELRGEEFEALLINKFNELGFKTIDTPKTGDYGADIIIETESETRIVVQCKRFKSKVNLKAVQEVVGAIAHYSGDIGLVITNSTYLNSAIKLAESNDIELWDNFKLMQFLSGDISFSQINEL